jgi:hypothetical protein
MRVSVLNNSGDLISKNAEWMIKIEEKHKMEGGARE